MSTLRQGAKLFIARHIGLFINQESCYLALCKSNYLTGMSLHASRCLGTMSISNHLSSRVLVNVSPFTHINIEQRRFKRKRLSKEDEEEEEDDDDDESAGENPLLMEDILDGSNDGSERMTINISSLRLDNFCKTAFSMTRAKVEELFYKGDIYLNGELVSKKSQDLSIGDEVDIVKSIDPEDSRNINIRRAIIVRLPDKASEHGRMKLEIQRWQNLVVESRELKGKV